jgi:hypothetical protein
LILKHLYFRRSDGYEREAIDGHIANVNGSVGNILSDNSNMTKAAEAKTVYSCRAVTTDFSF